MANKVGDKGQIVIEKPIRDALGVQPGFVAVQDLRADHVEIRFYPPEHSRSLRGVLAGRIERSVPPRRWQKARDTAWGDAVAKGPDAKKVER
ncbi:MAG TPA: AbrB/MazE/SpoVT family DNA-binding domain-containing protein [Thermoanaerobaculia bacterium]|nr:AbrB/MazE/SpoVT family DNA-binding domain-containing protein [Thermoanaerobaculia bacterium]